MLSVSTHILRIEEENVDGCGSTAVMYVEFSKPLSDEIQERFQGHLRAVKNIADACDRDTEEMVKAAIESFNHSAFARTRGCYAETCFAPYYGVVTF